MDTNDEKKDVSAKLKPLDIRTLLTRITIGPHGAVHKSARHPPDLSGRLRRLWHRRPDGIHAGAGEAGVPNGQTAPPQGPQRCCPNHVAERPERQEQDRG